MVEVGATLVGAHSDSSSGNPKARLLIVEDHFFMREGIKAILERDEALEVAGEARDAQEAISRCRDLHPDLILMDVSMPEMDGIEATRRIKGLYPHTTVLILTSRSDPQLLVDAVKAGAAGYVLKEDSQHRMLDAIRAVLGGETYLDQKLVMTLLRSLGEEADERGARSSAVPAALPATPVAAAPLQKPLTPRETEILGHLARGKTNRQIAAELHVSLSTVKRHLEHILPKLGVSDRTQAAVRAVEMGLRPPERSG
jgi:DNA-binding NarL/FixJ family response regulator